MKLLEQLGDFLLPTTIAELIVAASRTKQTIEIFNFQTEAFAILVSNVGIVEASKMVDKASKEVN